MFSRPVRFLLIVASVAFGGYQLYRGSVAGWFYLLAAALLTYGHFRYGPVWLAFRNARRGNLDRARRLLAQVKDPRLLSPGQRAYFELSSALVAADLKNKQAAENHLRLALEQRLRTHNDRALAEVFLAELLIERGAADEAADVLDRAAMQNPKAQVTRMIEELRNRCQKATAPTSRRRGTTRSRRRRSRRRRSRRHRSRHRRSHHRRSRHRCRYPQQWRRDRRARHRHLD